MKMARVTSAGLNMHETPNGRILGNETVSHGDMLETFEHRMTETTDWVRVRNPLSGARGWVASRFLQWPEESSPPLPPADILKAAKYRGQTRALNVLIFVAIAVIAIAVLAYFFG